MFAKTTESVLEVVILNHILPLPRTRTLSYEQMHLLVQESESQAHAIAMH